MENKIRKGTRVKDTIWKGSHVGTVVGVGREYGLPMVRVKWDRRRRDYTKSWPYDLIPLEYTRVVPESK